MGQVFLRGALWAILLLLALDNLGIDITALLAGLGIGGIAIALASQKILGDLFSALSIVLDKPFMVGDFIEIGDFTGTVEAIGLKNTRLRSAYGEQIIIPNSDLLQGRIRNYRDRSERRALFTIHITYQTPLEKLKKIPQWIKEIVEDQEHARFDRAHFKEYGDYSLNFEIVYYVMKPDFSLFIKIQERVNHAIFEKFQNENVYFAYPTQTILTQKGMNSS
ncbi:MAG: mechanosensitive ion channel family protein [Nitrospinae bacterium]|nr:mechanosensitive ion channel family protein [Nitrospinota bacterium]